MKNGYWNRMSFLSMWYHLRCCSILSLLRSNCFLFFLLFYLFTRTIPYSVFFFSSFVTSSKLKRFDFRIKRERNTLILIKVFVYGPGTVPLCRCWYFFSSLVYKRFNTRFFQINKCQECQLFSCFVYIFHFFYFTLLLSLYFNKEQFLPMNKLPLNNCVFFSFWWEAFHKNLCHCCYDKKRKAIQNHFSTLIFDKIDWPLNVTVIPFCSSSSSFFYVLLHISNFHFVCFYGNLHRRFIR